MILFFILLRDLLIHRCLHNLHDRFWFLDFWVEIHSFLYKKDFEVYSHLEKWMSVYLRHWKLIKSISGILYYRLSNIKPLLEIQAPHSLFGPSAITIRENQPIFQFLHQNFNCALPIFSSFTIIHTCTKFDTLRNHNNRVSIFNIFFFFCLFFCSFVRYRAISISLQLFSDEPFPDYLSKSSSFLFCVFCFFLMFLWCCMNLLTLKWNFEVKISGTETFKQKFREILFLMTDDWRWSWYFIIGSLFCHQYPNHQYKLPDTLRKVSNQLQN